MTVWFATDKILLIFVLFFFASGWPKRCWMHLLSHSGTLRPRGCGRKACTDEETLAYVFQLPKRRCSGSSRALPRGPSIYFACVPFVKFTRELALNLQRWLKTSIVKRPSLRVWPKQFCFLCHPSYSQLRYFGLTFLGLSFRVLGSGRSVWSIVATEGVRTCAVWTGLGSATLARKQRQWESEFSSVTKQTKCMVKTLRVWLRPCPK